MARTLLAQHWPAIYRDCRTYWGKLTDDDLAAIAGQYDAFVRALRRRYGFSQPKAEDELEQFLFQYGPPAVFAPAEVTM
jgi:uncharacterized protein YjbJ (UPF0337 family)